jgi:hypothetical protein
MITHTLNSPARRVAVIWLFILFTLGTSGYVGAQSVASGAFAVVEERSSQPNGQTRVSYTIATSFDSVPPPVRPARRVYKRVIQTTPTWPETEPPQWEKPAESGVPRAFYIIATSPISQPSKPGYGWINIYP